MAKITPYKFVNPGVVGTSNVRVVRATSTQLLATNRIGSVVEGIANVVADILVNNKATIIFQKSQIAAEKRQERLQLDAAAEEKQEKAKQRLGSQREIDAKDKKDDFDTDGVKKAGEGFAGWLEKFLGPLGSVFTDIATIMVAKGVTEWLSDPANTQKLQEFVERSAFVLNKIRDFVANQVNRILGGFATLINPENGFIKRLTGLGTMMTGIIALRYLFNPFALITDIVGLIDLAGNLFDKRERDFQRRVQDHNKQLTGDGKQTTPGGSPTTKVSPKEPPGLADTRRLHGRDAEKVYKNAYDNAIARGKNPSAAARSAQARVSKLLNSGKLKSNPLPTLSTKANKLLGTEGSSIFKRGLDKATQRFFLKIVGMGGVKVLQKTLNRIPVVGPLITFALNWASGESIARSAAMAVGSGLGQLLGTWAGGALGALGGPLAPFTVPLGAFVGNLLGSMGGELLGGWLYDAVTGRNGGAGELGGAVMALVKKAFEADWKKILSGAWDWIYRTISDSIGGIWNFLQASSKFVSGKAGTFFERLKKAMGKILKPLGKIFKKLIKPTYLPELFGRILANPTKIVDILSEEVKPLTELIVNVGKMYLDFGRWMWDNTLGAFFNGIAHLWSQRGKFLEFLTREGTFEETFGGKWDASDAIDGKPKRAAGGVVNPFPEGSFKGGPGQKYGDPRDYGGHAGIDITENHPYKSDPKRPIYAAQAGKVISEKYQTTGYLSGLMIDSGTDQLRYLHMTPMVKIGQTVAAGQQVGKLIDLGNQTHLHFEHYRGSQRFNPLGILRGAISGNYQVSDQDLAPDLQGAGALAPAAEAQPQFKDPGELFKFMGEELTKVFGSTEKKEDLKTSAFDPKSGLNVVDKETLAKMKFSKTYAMDKNALDSNIVPVAFNIPQPIYLPMPINNVDKVINAKPSPFASK